MQIKELPYHPHSAKLLAPLADRPWFMWLDSGRPAGVHAQFDVAVFDPVATLVTRGAVTEIRRGADVESSTDDPLTLLQKQIAAAAPADAIPGTADWPFAGGAAGYFAYDLGRRYERVPTHTVDIGGLPEMAVGIYDRAIVVDHDAQRCVYLGPSEGLPELIKHPLYANDRTPLRAHAEINVSLDTDAYRRAFDRIQEYIRAGDCYQVNLARRFSVQTEGDAWSGYLKLRERSPAPFGAYLNTPYAKILSNSPERFLQVRHGHILTRPIKGTRPRDVDAARDRQLAEELMRSAKDRAENTMIVDLLRNDLGKVCVFGSVRTDELCKLESFATVHHLVSTVSGQLAPGKHALDALRACFPGGSITGAPKIRAMEIIEELERERRGVYCGAIGYIGFDGSMDTSVAIRTLMHADGQARFWAGGGIVADSVCEREYEETLAKAAAMLEMLGKPHATT